MLYVYADESADATRTRVFAVAGIIGSAAQWSMLRKAWSERAGGIPFHAKDCESDQGPYRLHSHQENKGLYKDLTTLLALSGVGGWGIVVDLAAQRRVFPDAPDFLYYKGFLEVLHAMKNCASNNNETVHFTFDNRRESAFNAEMLYRKLCEWTEYQRYISGGLAFAAANEEPCLQAADLFAHEAMKALDNRVGPIPRKMRAAWGALHETGRFHVEALSDDWFKSLRDQLPQMESELGASQERYHAWLRENKLQHCTTSMLRFIGSL